MGKLKFILFQLFLILLLLVKDMGGLYAREYRPIMYGYWYRTPIPLNSQYINYINQLIDQGNKLYQSKPDSAIKKYGQVIKLSSIGGYKRGIALGFNNLSAAYKEKGNYDAAILLIKQSILMNRQRFIKPQISQFVDLSDLYVNKGDYKSILRLGHQLSPPKLTSKKQRKQWLRFLKYVAVAHYRMGDYDAALAVYYKILKKIEAPDSTNAPLYIEIYNGIGALSVQTGFDSLALNYFNRALALATKYQNKNPMVMSLGNIAGSYIKLKDYKNAKLVCLKALQEARKLKYYSYESLNASRMAAILSLKGLNNEALSYAEEARESAQKIQNFDNIITANYTTGYIYLQLKKYKKAESYLLPALGMAKDKGKLDNILTAYEQMVEIYKKTNRPKLALQYLEHYTKLKDSIIGVESARRIANIKEKFETTAKDKRLMQQQLLLSQKESKLKEKNLMIGGILIGTLLLLTIGIIKYLHKQKLQAVQLQHLANRHEIERLTFQMQGEEQERSRIARELHDGVSVLLSATKMNYIAIGKENNTLAETGAYKEIMQLLNQTAQELRAISYNLVPELIIQQSLPAAVQAFCDHIEKSHNLKIKLQTYGNFAHSNETFNHDVYRIIQELIQNIVKHAQATEVLLQLSLHNNILQLTVEDNGIGFQAKTSSAGMGLNNLRKRVEKLNGQLSFNSSFQIGTTFEIELPLT